VTDPDDTPDSLRAILWALCLSLAVAVAIWMLRG
jgi:hypothetical protein